jgi:hypothetical protein
MATKKQEKEPRKEQPAGILTTGMAIQGKPLSSIPGGASASAKVLSSQADTQQWENADASRTPGLPVQPKELHIASDLTLVTGVYLFAAPTGSGKTIMSMALVAMANANGVPASYVSCFEPRSNDSPSPTSSVGPPFSKPEQFWSDAASQLGKSSSPSLVIYDSCTLPLKCFASGKAYSSQSTFPGGMQPSDRGFIEAGSKLATKTNKCFIVVLNSTLVPYVNELAGATEGLINITSVTSFTYADRSSSSGRRMVEYTIPTPFIEGALSYFNFGPLRKGLGRFNETKYVL